MLDKVIEVIRSNQDLQDIEITGESQFVRDLGLSSLDLVDMCCQLEEEFGIEIREENLVHVITINDLVKCIKESEEN